MTLIGIYRNLPDRFFRKDAFFLEILLARLLLLSFAMSEEYAQY